MSAPEQQPWHAAYPKPISTTVFLPQAAILEWMESSEKIAGRDFVLVDLRRNDHEVCLFAFHPMGCEAALVNPSHPGSRFFSPVRYSVSLKAE